MTSVFTGEGTGSRGWLGFSALTAACRGPRPWSHHCVYCLTFPEPSPSTAPFGQDLGSLPQHLGMSTSSLPSLQLLNCPGGVMD